jgi:hypothetical protein
MLDICNIASIYKSIIGLWVSRPACSTPALSWLQDARYLDRQLVARMGAPGVANLAVGGGVVWLVGLWDGASAAGLTHFGTKFFPDSFLFNKQSSILASFSRSYFGSRGIGVWRKRYEAGATLLSGDVLDEPARSAADVGTGGCDVAPPEVQGTTRSRTRR